MSKATKVKYVRNEAMHQYQEPKGEELILKVLSGRGNNLHEVQDHTGASFLVSMPTKFRKTIYIKRGSFVLAVPISEGDKVKAEITGVFLPDDIRNLKALGKWPLAFLDQAKAVGAGGSAYVTEGMMPPSSGSESDADEFQSLRVNRPKFAEPSDSEDSDCEQDSDNNSHVEPGAETRTDVGT